MIELLPHQQRVVDEHRELADRKEKLQAFICTETFKNMPWGDAGLMIQQLGLMGQLEIVLAARIRRFYRGPDEE